MILVALAEALEDLDGVGHGGLVHHDLLETTLEGGVLFEVLAVLVERGGADGLQLTTGQHGLEDAGRVDRALGGSGADEGVDLVDEQDDVAAGLDLLQHLLEALLEITAVAGTGDERTEVEGVELLVLQGLGDIARRDLLGEALDDGGLADAGFADEHRVVLGAAAEHLHHPLGFLLAADDRIELLLAGELGEVATELVEHERTRGGIARATAGAGLLRGTGLGLARTGAGGAGVAREQLDDLLAHTRQIGAELHEHLGGNAFTLTDEAEQDVLGTDVVVAELQRLTERQFEHLLGARGEGDVS